MKKLDYLTRVIEAIVAVLMAGVTILTFVQVVRRFVFGAVFPWAEELAIYSMIWITFFGAVLCLRHGEHTRIDAFLLVLPHKIRKWIEVFDYVLCFAFMMLMSYHSIALLKMTGKLLSTAARLPMYYVYSALLVSGVLMIPYFIVLIYQKVMEKEAPKAPSTTDD
jgi:TRAP-type C4-dicarboxylate transport system permease small subunit